eukprot:g23926.t1
MDIATTLLEYGADTNTVTKQGITPVHLAAQEGHVDMVSLLLTRNADVNLGNKSLLNSRERLRNKGPHGFAIPLSPPSIHVLTFRQLLPYSLCPHLEWELP